ncbi:MAG: hypothetical protein WA825_00960, partial [Steroidobacteraceae bacterium]
MALRLAHVPDLAVGLIDEDEGIGSIVHQQAPPIPSMITVPEIATPAYLPELGGLAWTGVLL